MAVTPRHLARPSAARPEGQHPNLVARGSGVGAALETWGVTTLILPLLKRRGKDSISVPCETCPCHLPRHTADSARMIITQSIHISGLGHVVSAMMRSGALPVQEGRLPGGRRQRLMLMIVSLPHVGIIRLSGSWPGRGLYFCRLLLFQDHAPARRHCIVCTCILHHCISTSRVPTA
eukprot:scaffold146578_cov16-Tisochrysis_lutea.AAC.2